MSGPFIPYFPADGSGVSVTVPSTEIIVTQANAATTLGGTIDSTKIYLIDGEIDMGSTSIEVPATGIFLAGHNLDLSKLTSSDAGFTLFTSPAGGSGNVFARDLNFEISGTGSQVFDLVDATGFNAVEFARINYTACTSLGTLDSYRQGLETGTGRFGGQPELTLKGTWVGGFRITTSIVRGLTDGAYSLFKAGAGFTMASRFLTDMNCDLPASASLLDFAPANFPNPSTLQIRGAIITRTGVTDATDTNLTPNIAKSDLASQWEGNVGLGNTFEGGRLEVSAEITTVVSASSTFYDLLATWSTDALEHFDSPSSGQLRHLGNNPREYRVTVNFIIESQANNELEIRLRKWDDSASAFVNLTGRKRQVNNLIGGRDVAIFNYVFNVPLDQNDYVYWQAANNSGTQNIIVELGSDWFIEER